MAVVTIRQLLDSGVHFGHQTRRWNPKMKRFILTARSGSHIIDLQQSLKHIDTTYDYVKETVAHGGTILFVGTKKQAQEAIQEQATRVGQPFVNQRWLGGLLTNFQTVSKRLARMKELEEIDFDDTTKGFTKKELLIQKRELVKLHKTLGGIRNLTKTPSAIWVVDAKREHLAVSEATKLGIPVIGILDTNADPDELQYPIPGNDDAIRSVGLLTRIIADAVAEGLIQRHAKPEEAGNVSAVEPLAEWERELLEPAALADFEMVKFRSGLIPRSTKRVDLVSLDGSGMAARVGAKLGLTMWHLADANEFVVGTRRLGSNENPASLRMLRLGPEDFALEVTWLADPPSEELIGDLEDDAVRILASERARSRSGH